MHFVLVYTIIKVSTHIDRVIKITFERRTSMTEILILSSKNYPDSDSINYGDCILIRTDSDFIIYDCGHEKHAEEVLSYMDRNNITSAKIILSHNDSDHFDGIQKLLESGRISVIKTTLLLKYKDEILERIDDGRKTRESVSQKILELYDNITQLSGYPLEDIYEKPEDICQGVTIIGPDFEYMLDTVAKRLDGREGDNKDGETAVNATSIQVSVKIGIHKVLLCGDCSFTSIEDKVRNYECIQLPHHGKPKQAELIWEKKWNQTTNFYFISDNTGNSNGGSDNLDTTGHRVYNTKGNDNIKITSDLFSNASLTTGRTLGY